MAQSIRARNVSEVACSSDVHDSLPRRICCKSPGGICGSFLCTVQRSRTMLKGACRGYYVEDRSPGSDYWLTATNSGSCPFSALLNMPEDETLIFICGITFYAHGVSCPLSVIQLSQGELVSKQLYCSSRSPVMHIRETDVNDGEFDARRARRTKDPFSYPEDSLSFFDFGFPP